MTTSTTTPLAGRCILLVEDDYLVAQALAELLTEAGATVLGPIGWVDEALAFIRECKVRFDSALLDINLHGEKSYSIVEALRDVKVRVVFMTGYGESAVDAQYKAIPRCEKPFDPQVLFQTLIQVHH